MDIVVKQFGIEKLNNFNISIGVSLKILNELDGEKVNMAKGHLLDSLRWMSEYFVESNQPIKEQK